MIGAIDAAGVVDGVGAHSAAVEGEFDAPELGRAQVAAFAKHLAAQLAAVDAHRVVGAVADRGVGLAGGLDVGADAAVVEQVDRRLEDAADQLGGRQRGGVGVEHRTHLVGERDRLGAARPDAAARGDQCAVVVVPRRARQGEHAVAFGPAGFGVWIGVEKDVTVVEGRDELDLARQQHAVAEYVARHVADADHGERFFLGVDAHFAEVAFDRFPRAARGDAHLLVVITHRAARGEGVVEPEAVLGGDGVGNVGEGGGALVGSDHEVGVVLVMPHHRGGGHDVAEHEVVGQVEETGQEGAVAGDAFGQHGFAVAAGWRILDHEAALGADRHDDRILDDLGFHQAENLGAEVFHPVRPAQPAAGDLAAAQVDALDPRRVHEDLEHRLRFGQVGDASRVELERQVGLGPAILAGLEVVGPQGGLDDGQKLAQDAVFVEVGDGVEGGVYFFDKRFAAGAATDFLRGIEARLEQRNQLCGERRVMRQRLLHVGLAEGEGGLLHVLGVGAQHGNLAPAEAGEQGQPVEVVVLDLAAPHALEGFVEQRADRVEVELFDAFKGHAEVMHPHQRAVAAFDAVGALFLDLDAGAFEHRQAG